MPAGVQRFSFWVLAAAQLAALGCGVGSAQNAGGRPDVIRYATSASVEQVEGRAAYQTELRKYLARKLRVRVETTLVTGYGSTIQAMCAKKVDVASQSPLPYIIASARGCAEPLVVRGLPDGTPGVYHAVIAVSGSSPIRDMADLKRYAAQSTFAFGDPASTSGHLLPRGGLIEAHIDAEKEFKRVLYSANHTASVMALVSGKVDAAGVMERQITRLLEKGKLKPGEIRVIWKSPPMLSEATVVRKDLPQEFKEEIRQALLAMPTEAPELIAALRKIYVQYFGAQANQLVYLPANDAMYDPIRRLARSVPALKLVEDAE